jgi:multidrug resistance efflux pump
MQVLARWVVAFLVISVLAMFFLPWQQSAKGTGRVVSFVPQERQQTVMAPVKGIVAMVTPGLREGDKVKEGDVILELQPAVENLEDQLLSQKADLATKLETAKVKIEVYERQVEVLSSARDSAVDAADEMVKSAIAKFEAKKKLVPGYEAKKLQVQLNFDRQQNLQKVGAASPKDIESLRKDLDVAISDLASVLLEVEAADREVASKRFEREQKLSEAESKVESARAYEQQAIGEEATINKEIRDLEIKLAELKQQTIRAPRDGTIFRLPIFERGQTVKEGEPLFTIIPETEDLAVEMWINGNDAPLVHLQDHVRLQFEGWPAAQFAGWPSVAIGTFGGEVVAIDQTDDGLGKFRIQVRPTEEFAWPDKRYLRQGVRANAWVMLGRVTIGYEIWRRINGFPQSIPTKESEEKQEPKPKLKIG